jgi:hypothetical protein
LYYLADGIYPEWAIFVKSISMPINEKDQEFANHQEGKRKDIERAFGVLRRRWCILKRPARLHDQKQLENVIVEEPKFSFGESIPFERVLENQTDLQDHSAHLKLKKDLVEHIWQKYGRR